MENQESDIITKIMFISIFLVIMLLALVIIIGALNSSNQQVGSVFNNQVSNESTYFQNTQSGVYYLSANNLVNSKCSITSITLFNGTLVDPSNYTINNCQVTFK